MTFDEIGLVMRETRKKQKWTQERLAAHLRMSRATISGIENNTIPEIGIRKVISILDGLGLEFVVQVKAKRPTLQQLMKEHDEEKRKLLAKTKRHTKSLH